MEKAPDGFLLVIQEKLALRAEWMETILVPKLKEELRTFRALLGSVVDTLVKKGLLRVDRYDYDDRPTAIETPPDSSIPDTAESEIVSARLTAYNRQLEFLLDGCPFSLIGLDLATLRKISSLIAYIDWSSFGEATHSPTTRAFARLAAKVLLGPDALSARVLHESQAQIKKLVVEIVAHLAEVGAWHREAWKAEIRAKVLPSVETHGAHAKGDKTEGLLLIRKAFDKALPEDHWHSELVKQILDEDHAEDSATRRQKLLSSLDIPRPELTVVTAKDTRRDDLIAAVRSLCQVGPDLASGDAVLVEDERTLEKRTLGFLQRLRRFFQKRSGRLDDRYYDIKHRESANAEPRTDKVNFLQFIAELREIRGALSEIADESGREGHWIAAATENELFDFLDWQVRQLRHVHRKMEGLNELFQLKAIHERGLSVPSIKLELLRIENGIARADKVRHDFVSRRSQ